MEDALHTLTPDAQLFRDVFNASPIGIAVENLEGQLLFVNLAFCSMLSFSEQELRSKHCMDFSPSEDAEKDWALFQQLRAGSIDHYQLEKRYFRRDGSLVWGNLSVSLMKSRPSPLILAMIEDITAKKTAEEARFRHAAIVESSGGRHHLQESGRCHRELERGCAAYFWMQRGGSSWTADIHSHST